MGEKEKKREKEREKEKERKDTKKKNNINQLECFLDTLIMLHYVTHIYIHDIQQQQKMTRKDTENEAQKKKKIKEQH